MQNHNTMHTGLVSFACGWLRNFAFCVSLVFVYSMPASAEVEFTYDKNTFINYWSCLGIYAETSLELDEKIWVFSTDQSPFLGKVDHMIQTAEAQLRFDALGFTKVYDDKPLWAEIGCIHYFRGDMPELLARVSPEPEDSSSIGFALRGLPEDAWIAGGKGDSVALDVKDNPFLESVRHLVTDACYAPDSLVRVKQFPIKNKGSSITQLDIGKVKKVSSEKKKQNIEEELRQTERVYTKRAWPEYKKKRLEELENKDYIESVEICRFYLNKSRVLMAENISRSTGAEERVDTPTDLDGENWADTTESAIGFISLNEGKDWDVLRVDVGFEGIHYSIRRLSDSVVHYNRSLYTYH